MVDIRPPRLFYRRFGRPRLEPIFEEQRRYALADEGILVRPDEHVAVGERVGRDRQVHRRAHGFRILAQRTLVIADWRHAGQRKDRQRHVEIQVRNDALLRHGRAAREIAGAQQSLLLRRDDREQDRPFGLHLTGFERAPDLQQARNPGRIVQRAIIDRIALDRRAHAIAVQMRRQHDIFLPQLRVATGQHRDQIGR